jgi:hypothetical protein
MDNWPFIVSVSSSSFQMQQQSTTLLRWTEMLLQTRAMLLHSRAAIFSLTDLPALQGSNLTQRAIRQAVSVV